MSRLSKYLGRHVWLTKQIRKQGDQTGAIRFFISGLVSSKRTVKIRVAGNSILVRPNSPDFQVANSCFSGEFDLCINKTQRVHNFIIDAGGYIGAAAIVFAKAFPRATILTLEPSIENFKILTKNVALYPNIIPLNVALGGIVGKTRLINRGTEQVGFSIVQTPADCVSPAVLQETDVTTVPHLMQTYSKSGVDLLKLDIEGAEYDLFTGQPDWIGRVGAVFVELHDRIVPGCESAFLAAMKGRSIITGTGEKILSLSRP